MGLGREEAKTGLSMVADLLISPSFNRECRQQYMMLLDIHPVESHKIIM